MSDDFSWFDQEMARTKWKTFHILSHHITEAQLSDLCPFGLQHLEKELRNFILRYGNCNLFRRLRVDWYRLNLQFKPGEFQGNPVFFIGHHWEEAECFVKSGSPVVHAKWGSDGSKVMDDSFSQWLKARVRKCKSEMKAAEWELVLEPPKPFDENEKRIVDAIALYTFRKVGITEDNNTFIEVENGSGTVLPTVTVGVTSERVKGAIRLDVSGILPKSKKVISANCYKELVPPSAIDVYKLPAPTPEDRLRFCELRDLQKRRLLTKCSE